MTDWKSNRLCRYQFALALTAIVGLSQLHPTFAASAPSDATTIGKLEQRIFSHQYPKEPLSARIARLEKFTYGTAGSGQTAPRVARLQKTLAEQPIAALKSESPTLAKAPAPANAVKTAKSKSPTVATKPTKSPYDMSQNRNTPNTSAYYGAGGNYGATANTNNNYAQSQQIAARTPSAPGGIQPFTDDGWQPPQGKKAAHGHGSRHSYGTTYNGTSQEQYAANLDGYDPRDPRPHQRHSSILKKAAKVATFAAGTAASVAMRSGYGYGLGGLGYGYRGYGYGGYGPYGGGYNPYGGYGYGRPYY